MITYMHEQFIAHAIESVLMQQANFDFELVIGEDCSTDQTRSIINIYSEKYPSKIKLLESKDNLGVKENFIRTLQSCTGEYIACLEGDDYWTDPLKLQKQVNFFENDTSKKYSLCYHDSYVINSDGVLICDSLINGFEGDLTSNDVILGKTIPTQTVMFRKECLELMTFKKLKAKNLDTFLFTLLSQKGKLRALSDVGNSVYRIHSGGIWSNLDIKAKYLESLLYQSEVYNYLNRIQKKLVVKRIYDMSNEIIYGQISFKDYLFFKLECIKVLIEKYEYEYVKLIICDLFNIVKNKVKFKLK